MYKATHMFRDGALGKLWDHEDSDQSIYQWVNPSMDP